MRASLAFAALAFGWFAALTLLPAPPLERIYPDVDHVRVHESDGAWRVWSGAALAGEGFTTRHERIENEARAKLLARTELLRLTKSAGWLGSIEDEAKVEDTTYWGDGAVEIVMMLPR